jgi:hypothetical protein
MRRSPLLLGAAACLIAAGCGRTPASPDALSVRPMHNGYTYGSGNAVDPGTGTATAPTVAAASDTGSVQRGGYTYGSGN